MFVAITNTPRDYAWGGPGAISELLGWPPSDAVEAELWLGTHAGSPSRLVNDDATLGDAVGIDLPFLLKVLSAASPLSLQAHPDRVQAGEGFLRENAAGIPIDSSIRNYRDASAKPEILYALSHTFDALCGFRPVRETRAVLRTLLDRDAVSAAPGPEALGLFLDRLETDTDLPEVFRWLVTRAPGVHELVARVSSLADDSTPHLQTARELALEYPGDPGIVVSLLLNRVTLKRGEALYLPAGNIHAYLRGTGIELMTASDNVLRGGLTNKHVDVPELLRVLDFSPLPVPYLQPARPRSGVTIFRPGRAGFALTVVEQSATVPLTGVTIALCVDGDFELCGKRGATHVQRGEAVYVSADETEVAVTGVGQIFLASAC